MKSKSVFASLIALACAACGTENAIVGGQCKPGYAPRGHVCAAVTSPSTGEPDPVEPTNTDVDDTEPRPSKQTQPIVSEIGKTPPEPIGPVPNPEPELVCNAPEVACRGECIPVESDGQNCGACGKICPSNICIAGVCQGATPGDVVLVGHDFADTSPGTAEAKVFANAMTIATSDPIRVLAWNVAAKPTAVARQKAILAASGRSFMFASATSEGELASATLARDYDVVLVNDAAGEDPVARGAGWSTALGTFVAKGGSVVFLDGGTTAVPDLVASTGLLGIDGHAKLGPKTHLVVSAPADVVGAQLMSPYASFGAAMTFSGVDVPSTDVSWVVRVDDGQGTGDPVVVHRVVR